MKANKTRTALSVISLTALSLMVCITTFTILAGNHTPCTSITKSLLVNFPLCLALSMFDYMLISRIRHKWAANSYIHIAVDWLLTSVVGMAFSLLAKHIIGADTYILEGCMAFLVWNCMIVFGIELYIYHCNVMEKETELARIEKEKASYRFEALKNQINPHFLFNSLNVLAALAYQDAERANLFAKKLSCVYRYLLTTYDKQLVTLDEETDFMNAYIYLEKIRFGNAVRINIAIDECERNRMVVPAGLQMLVENALKHNISSENMPLHINISAHNGIVTVTNNLQPRNEVSTNKIGLANLRKQYLIHKRDINITKTDTSFTVSLPLIQQ